jgi:hypothetical protein
MSWIKLGVFYTNELNHHIDAPKFSLFKIQELWTPETGQPEDAARWDAENRDHAVNEI